MTLSLQNFPLPTTTLPNLILPSTVLDTAFPSVTLPIYLPAGYVLPLDFKHTSDTTLLSISAAIVSPTTTVSLHTLNLHTLKVLDFPLNATHTPKNALDASTKTADFRIPSAFLDTASPTTTLSILRPTNLTIPSTFLNTASPATALSLHRPTSLVFPINSTSTSKPAISTTLRYASTKTANLTIPSFFTFLDTASPATTLRLHRPTSLVLPINSTHTPTTTIYLPVASAANLIPRNTQGDCSPQPTGIGLLLIDEDTPQNFYVSRAILSTASHVPTPQTPVKYTRAFSVANASYSGTTYLGHYELRSYDPSVCAAHYTEQPCKGFNIYFERSPSIHLGPGCKTASTRTLVKCALWGEELIKKAVVNRGSKEWDFEVVIAGSNGYHLERFGSGSETHEEVSGGQGERLVAGVGVTAWWFVVGVVVVGGMLS
ncbi:Galactose oxidase [Pyrenophora seminiperda CCB06]|uniref:Galactose oxidase n=1 Tax=Pyrenophora seminiperda CCB06 TaxID=1302712 RepID=A0A3M7MFA9_9PLEO|nr:Galactose oxidase [Pyrenophora seminiperda CCB06]